MPLRETIHSPHSDSIPDSWNRFDLHPDYQQLRILNEGAEKLGVGNPFFRVHDGLAGATTVIGGETFTNFSSYNYLGLAGHPEVNSARRRRSTATVPRRRRAGSSPVDAPIHRELEQAIAASHGVDNYPRVRERSRNQRVDDRAPVRAEGSDRA